MGVLKAIKNPLTSTDIGAARIGIRVRSGVGSNLCKAIGVRVIPEERERERERFN